MAVEPGSSTPPLLPLFVAGFLAAVAIRTTDVLSSGALAAIKDAESILLTAAMVGLGSGVRIAELKGLGHQPVVLGVLSWFVVAGISLVGVLLTSG